MFQPVTNGEVVREAFEKSPIKIGENRQVLMVIFLDVNCPVCKGLLERSGEMLLEYARSGVMSLGLCTYTLFEESEPLHRYLNCLPEGERLDALMKLVKRVKLEPTCQGENRCTEVGKAMGVIGTPTIVGFNYRAMRGYRFDGYLSPSELSEFIDRLVSG